LVGPTLQFPVSSDLDRFKLSSHLKPEKDSLLQELRRIIRCHGRGESIAKLTEATLIKLCDINGAWSSDHIKSWLHPSGPTGEQTEWPSAHRRDQQSTENSRKLQKASAPWVPPRPPPPASYDRPKSPPLEPFNGNLADSQMASALYAVRGIVDSVGASIRSRKKDGDDESQEITIFIAYQMFLNFSDSRYHIAREIYESDKGKIMILMDNEAKQRLLKTRLERARHAR
jgi:hypothetical protein